MIVWSVGHSTHDEGSLLALLRAHGVESVADVRTVPRSRRLPHFAAERMAVWLPEAGIAYRHLSRLGGWRRASPDSPNGGWRNASFRGYADYALTAEFAAGLGELRELAAAARTAMLCSEGLWWRCHRRIVADRLVIAGDRVCHIAPDGRATPHEMTPFGVPQADGTLVYPG